jgi:acetyltransferase-like isoleucine patch superfamily enzyme
MFQFLYLLLRDIAYKNRFRINSNNSLEIHQSVRNKMKKVTIKLRGRNNRLVIGENTEITNCEIRLYGEDNLIEIGSSVHFKSGKIYLLNTHGQHIRIGAETTVEGAYLLVDEAASIDIGKDCMLATDILIRTGDKHSILDSTNGQRINPARDVRIADRVWVGRSAMILKGTVLHAETVVGACSLVTRAFDEGSCIVAGVPAKIVRRGVQWDRSML